MVAVGVALNESKVDAGRWLLVAGLALTVVGVIVVFWPRAPMPAPALPPPPVDGWPEVAALARRIGLTPQGRAATGKHNGRRVSLTIPQASERGRACAFLIRPLDMGLRMGRGNVGGDARRRVMSGNPAFDASYSVRADEHKRAAAILTDRLCELLVQNDVVVDDEHVEVTAAANREALTTALRVATKVANELERKSSHVPCARALRTSVDSWLDFAANHHLATTSTPLAMWGDAHGMCASAIAVRDAFENFHFEISATFPTPLHRGLSLRPASAATPLALSGEALSIASFDKWFTVGSDNPADTIRLIAPEVRTGLIELRNRGLQVRADDTRLWAWVGLNLAEPLLVPETLLQLAALAAQVNRNAARLPQS